MFQLVLYLSTQALLAGIGTLLVYSLGFLVLQIVFPTLKEPLERCILSFSSGFFLFGLLGYGLGWTNMRWVSFPFLVFVLLVIWRRKKMLSAHLQHVLVALRSLGWIPTVLIVSIVVLQSLQMVGNGLPLNSGTWFFRTNAYDGVFHLGLIESIVRTIPPEEPSSSGVLVANYHYWSDLIFAEYARIFFVAPAFLFFQFFPILLSFLSALAILILIRMFSAFFDDATSHLTVVIGLLFSLLGSDAGWILTWWVQRTFSFEYPVIDSSVTQFLNMPHAFAKFVFLSACVLFLHWRKHQDRSYGLLLVLGAFLFGLKVYFGVFISVGMLGVFTLDFILSLRRKGLAHLREKQLHERLVAGVIFLVLVACIYLPVNAQAGGLSWYPLEWPKLFINPLNLDWKDLSYRYELARLTKDSFRELLYSAALVLVGLTMIHGIRMLGFLVHQRFLQANRGSFFLFFILPTFIFTFLGFTTLQDSGGLNVFNFFAVTLVLLPILLALSLVLWFQRMRAVLLVFVVCIAVFMFPRTFFETWSMVVRYMKGTDSVRITPSDHALFDFLSTLPDDAVIAAPLDHPLESKSTYVAAYTGRRSFLSGIYLLETHNQPFEEKRDQLQELFRSSTLADMRELMKRWGITHVILRTTTASTVLEASLAGSEDQAVFRGEGVLVFDRGIL